MPEDTKARISSLLAAGPEKGEREAFFRSVGRHLQRHAGGLFAVMEAGTDERDIRREAEKITGPGRLGL